MGSKLPNPARLACLRRAASVRSEPGSNSPRLCPRPEGLEISSFGLNPSKIIVELIDRIRKSALSGGLSGFRDAEPRAFGFLRLPPSLPFSSLPCLFQRAPPVFQSGKRESSAFRKNCQEKSALFLNFFLIFFRAFFGAGRRAQPDCDTLRGPAFFESGSRAEGRRKEVAGGNLPGRARLKRRGAARARARADRQGTAQGGWPVRAGAERNASGRPPFASRQIKKAARNRGPL